MNFKTVLKQYMKKAGCTAKELSEASGVSASVISRYSTGERIPHADNDTLTCLADALEQLAKKNNCTEPEMAKEQILNSFQDALTPPEGIQNLAQNLNYIIDALDINVAVMARAMSYDASFLSRIRSGSRKPANISDFLQKLSSYLSKYYQTEEAKQIFYGDEVPPADESTAAYAQVIRNWFFHSKEPIQSFDRTAEFLQKLDEFNLDDYIRSIHFDELKVPTAPFQFRTSKEYRGIEGQKNGELDFMKGTVLSKSNEPVFLSSDMDMSDMAEDMEFSKKWMFGLAMILKRNLEIHDIHNLNRPFDELMLGLEAWIPLYMTGQVFPYYLTGAQNDLYQHLLYTSGTYALSGEGIRGSHNKAKYLLTNNKEAVAYYKERAASILKKAHPLMDIYTEDREEAFQQFLRKAETEPGSRHYISSSLPVFVLPDIFLSDILKRAEISDKKIKEILQRITEINEMFQTLLLDNELLWEIPSISAEEFEKHPVFLDLTEYGYSDSVPYSYEEYMKHTEYLQKYADAHENYVVRLCKDFAFRNIRIRILKGKWVCISKMHSPFIHFVIRHPKLRDAIENMQIPVYD